MSCASNNSSVRRVSLSSAPSLATSNACAASSAAIVACSALSRSVSAFASATSACRLACAVSFSAFAVAARATSARSSASTACCSRSNANLAASNELPRSYRAHPAKAALNRKANTETTATTRVSRISRRRRVDSAARSSSRGLPALIQEAHGLSKVVAVARRPKRGGIARLTPLQRDMEIRVDPKRPPPRSWRTAAASKRS